MQIWFWKISEKIKQFKKIKFMWLFYIYENCLITKRLVLCRLLVFFIFLLMKLVSSSIFFFRGKLFLLSIHNDICFQNVHKLLLNPKTFILIKRIYKKLLNVIYGHLSPYIDPINIFNTWIRTIMVIFYYFILNPTFMPVYIKSTQFNRTQLKIKAKIVCNSL